MEALTGAVGESLLLNAICKGGQLRSVLHGGSRGLRYWNFTDRGCRSKRIVGLCFLAAKCGGIKRDRRAADRLWPCVIEERDLVLVVIKLNELMCPITKGFIFGVAAST